MKKLIIFAAIFGMLFTTTSCEDLLETESKQLVFDPALDQKTDSMYYTLAILKGVQMAIDQNVLINEMRGDLTATTQYTQTALRELADFSAGANNKYDSAYVYYRIINNCNYYIAHRDTMLLTGAQKVAIPEYVQALSIRAWAYMQLCKNYGTVDFYTTPITSISEADAPKEKKDLAGVVAALAPELIRYSGTPVPNYGDIDAGGTNFGETKTVQTRKIMFPVDLVLGDMYLETNQYELAAKSYFKYLRDKEVKALPYYAYPSIRFTYPNKNSVPSTYANQNYTVYSWFGVIFTVSWTASEHISHVPMAVNALKGTTTNLPKLFGYNFYTTDVDTTNNQSQTSGSAMYILEREIEASNKYVELCNSQEWYYRPTSSSTEVLAAKLGDMRKYYTVEGATKGDSTFNRITKYDGGNIVIYREANVYLRLAEALNRMGYPDAAFAILKDGISQENLAQASDYLRPETFELLTTTIPFLSKENGAIFNADNKKIFVTSGIHARGAYETAGTHSPYQMDTIVGSKLKELAAQGLAIGETLNDTINAVEDLICDEFALECAFEGTRFGDLTRMARHKNADTTYGSNYGGQWIARKLAHKHPVKDLTDEKNWFLPMK